MENVTQRQQKPQVVTVLPATPAIPPFATRGPQITHTANFNCRFKDSNGAPSGGRLECRSWSRHDHTLLIIGLVLVFA